MDYNRLVGMSHEQALLHETQIMMATSLKEDPRLQPGFPFYGRYFRNKAEVIAYHPETDKLDVKVYYGSQGSSYIEYGWDACHYIHGFDDSSYLPLMVLPDSKEPEHTTQESFHVSQKAYVRH